MSATSDELAARRLLVIAEQTEAAARTERAFDRLSAASTLENFTEFFAAFTDMAQVIAIDHQQAVVAITLDTLAALKNVPVGELLVPTQELSAAEVATAQMLDIIEARYQGGLTVSNVRMTLQGIPEEAIAARRLADLHGDLPEGMASLYRPARSSMTAEVRSAVAIMGQIAWLNSVALNGGAT